MKWLCNMLCGTEIEDLKSDLYLSKITLVSLKNRFENLENSYNKATSNFSKEKQELLKTIQTEELKIQNLVETITEYDIKLEKLGEYILPEDIKKIIDFYNNKYQHVKLKHLSYMFAKNKFNFSMDMRNWITPFDVEIEEYCNGKNIKTVREYISEGNPFHKACDLVVNDFLSSYRPNYKWDKNEFIDFNISDLWQMPFQTKIGWQGDCEDWSNFVISCLNNRGIPSGLTRNVCGKTYNEYGHSTVNYLASDLIWRHIEATSSYGIKPDILTIYNIHDERDKANIDIIWYSFSHTHANSSWTKDEQAESWKEYERNKYVVIENE